MALPKSKNQGLFWIITALVFGLLLDAGFSVLWFKKHEKIEPIDEKDVLVNDLSVQEKKVLKLLESGLSNKVISSELNIGVNTVKSHVRSVLGKLKVKSMMKLMV